MLNLFSVAGRSGRMFRKHSFHNHLPPDTHGGGMPSARRMARQQTVTRMSAGNIRSLAKSRRGDENTHFNSTAASGPHKQEPTPETRSSPLPTTGKDTLSPAMTPSRVKVNLSLGCPPSKVSHSIRTPTPASPFTQLSECHLLRSSRHRRHLVSLHTCVKVTNTSSHSPCLKCSIKYSLTVPTPQQPERLTLHPGNVRGTRSEHLTADRQRVRWGSPP